MSLLLQVEEVLISLVGLVKRMIEEATGNISTCVQEAARHLHDQAILVSLYILLAK